MNGDGEGMNDDGERMGNAGEDTRRVNGTVEE